MTVAQLWERARPHIEDALAHAGGTHAIEDVLGGIAEGRLQLWVGDRCAGVSEILNFPRRRVLNLFLAGGDMAEMRTLQAGLEAFARGSGCQAAMFSGRLTRSAVSGWPRAWPDYHPTHICMTKEL